MEEQALEMTATTDMADEEEHFDGIPNDPARSPLNVFNGKLAMWVFLVMDAMTFAGLLAGYARLRWAPESGWPNPFETFGSFGINLTALNTFVLICSSVTMVHALAAALHGDKKKQDVFLFLTIIGGSFFLGVQGYEWTHLIVDVNVLEVENFNFAATFFSLTGFHGMHVFIGVVYLSVLFVMSRMGMLGTEEEAEKGDDEPGSGLIVEIAGLYWHFVDLIWILVFTFVYLL